MAWWLFVVLPLLLGAILLIYYQRRFAVLENRCDESWANVDTELRRRADLIPNLVKAVKGYANHEKSVLEEVTKARRAARRAEDVKARRTAEDAVAYGVERLLAVAEAYPELKASTNFLKLQHELAITEDRIQAARRFYNANVRDHRDLGRQFPGTVFAKLYRAPVIPFFRAHTVKLPEVALA